MKGENIFDPKMFVGKKGQIPKIYVNNVSLMLDVVGFSKEMTNQKMVQIVTDLQQSIYAVLEGDYYWAEKEENSNKNDFILIPTGDGYGLSLSNLLADDKILNIATLLYKSLVSEGINIRMGIAKGYNVITVDLNTNLNVFGYGIVLATRTCNAAKDNQILIEATLAESLNQNKKIPELKKIEQEFTTKHDFKFSCYNYYKESEFGIPLS